MIKLEECDASDDNQIWRIDQRGYLHNKGMGNKCLEGKDNGDLMINCCSDEFNPNQSFGVLEFHGTIVAMGVKNGLAITVWEEDDQVYLQDYMTHGRTDLSNQWTSVLIQSTF